MKTHVALESRSGGCLLVSAKPPHRMARGRYRPRGRHRAGHRRLNPPRDDGGAIGLAEAHRRRCWFSSLGSSRCWDARCLYNSNTNEKLSRLFERFDLSGIFIMIAASYTPFMLAKLDGTMAWMILGIVWAVALAGVALNLLAAWNAPKVYIGMYIALGWAVLSIVDKLIHSLAHGPWPAAGGRRGLHGGTGVPPQQEAAVQLGDLARLRGRGASLHFAAIYLDIASPRLSAAGGLERTNQVRREARCCTRRAFFVYGGPLGPASA